MGITGTGKRSRKWNQKRKQVRSYFWKRRERELFRIQILKMLVIAALVLLSLFSWIYVFTVKDEVFRSVLAPELIASVLVFAGNLVCVLLLGYEEDFFRHVCITLFITALTAIIALYISGVRVLLEIENMKPHIFFSALRFLVYAALSFVMGLLPSVIDCGLILFIVRVFGEPED